MYRYVYLQKGIVKKRTNCGFTCISTCTCICLPMTESEDWTFVVVAIETTTWRRSLLDLKKSCHRVDVVMTRVAQMTGAP